MNPSAVRFGHIGMIFGPKQNAQKLLDALKERDGGNLYVTENWSENAKTGLEPLYIYLSGEHVQEGENRPYPELFNQFHYEEFTTSHPASSFIGEDTAASTCHSGKGEARIHKVFNLQA